MLSRSSKRNNEKFEDWHLNFFRIEKLFRVAVFFLKASLWFFVRDNERGATTTTNRIDDDNSGNETRFVVLQLIFSFFFSLVVVAVREKEQQ